MRVFRGGRFGLRLTCLCTRFLELRFEIEDCADEGNQPPAYRTNYSFNPFHFSTYFLRYEIRKELSPL
jgi:hypothetical protein